MIVQRCRQIRVYGINVHPRLLAIVLLIGLLLPLDVLAACNADGLFTLGGGKGQCDAADKGVLASVLCLFENTLTNVLATLYCGFQDKIQSPLKAALSAAVLVFGVSVFTGYIRLTYKEAASMVLKLALVYAFVTNSDYGIQIAAKLSMAVLQEGTQIAVSPMGGNTSLTQPDTLLTGLFGFVNNPDPAATNKCGGADCLNDSVMKIFSNCALVLTVLGLTLVFFMPAILVFVITALLQYLKLYVYSFLNYLSSVVILTFLFALSPLFFSFYLFNLTKPLFYRWVQYVTSFSIQSIIVFAFMAMMVLVSRYFTFFIYSLMKLLRPYDITLSAMLMTIPVPHGCSICEYKITVNSANNNQKEISCQMAIQSGWYDAHKEQRIVVPDRFQPKDAVDGTNTTAFTPTAINGSPITYKLKQGSVLSDTINNIPDDATQNGGRNYVIPLQNLLKETDFLFYLMSNLIALWVVAKVMQEFIEKVPELASALGGVMSVGLSGKSGYESGIRFPGIDTAVPGMKTNLFDAAGNYVASSLQSSKLFEGKQSFFRRVGAGMLGLSGAALVRASYSQAAQQGAAGESNPFSGSGFTYSAAGSGVMTDEQIAKEREERERQEKEAAKRVEEANKELQAVQAENQQKEQAAKKAQQELEAVQEKIRLNKNDEEAQTKFVAASLAYKKAFDAFEQSSEQVRGRKRVLDQKKQELSNIRYLQKKNPLVAAALAGEKGMLGPQFGKGSLLAGGAALVGAQAKGNEKLKSQTQSRQVTGENPGEMATGPLTRGRATPDAVALAEAQGVAASKMSDLENKLQTYGSLMDAADQEALQKIIERTKARLGDAVSAANVTETLHDLAEVEKALARFSGKTIMQNAATAGIAGAELQLAVASATIPSAYLRGVSESVSRARQDAAGAKDDKQLEKVVNSTGQVPGQLLNAAINAGEQQYVNASAIVPEEALTLRDADLRKIEADAKKANDGKEQMQLVRAMREYPQQLVSDVVGVLGVQQDVAHSLVMSEYLAAFDRQMEDARERLKHAATGDQYDMILRDLANAPKTLLSGVISGLEEQSQNISHEVPEGQREAIQRVLEQAKSDLASARSGAEYNAILHHLVDASKEIKAVQGEQQGERTAREEIIPASAVAADGGLTGGLMSIMGVNSVAGAPAPKRIYGQADSEETGTRWRSTKDIGTSISNAWEAAGQRVSGIASSFNDIHFTAQPTLATELWDGVKKKYQDHKDDHAEQAPVHSDGQTVQTWEQVKKVLYTDAPSEGTATLGIGAAPSGGVLATAAADDNASPLSGTLSSFSSGGESEAEKDDGGDDDVHTHHHKHHKKKKKKGQFTVWQKEKKHNLLEAEEHKKEREEGSDEEEI